ncbi:MAG: KH domain-containing protein [Actinomycetes bacterium]|nr:KH domain-containing protein [Solirubrobacterales bacterium]
MATSGEMLEQLVRSVVEHPDSVSVRESDDNGTLLLELSVHDEDYGRVIGREGRTAHALRTVVKAAAHGDRRVFIDIVD